MLNVNEMRETAMKNLRILEQEFALASVEADTARARVVEIGRAYDAALIASNAWETALADENFYDVFKNGGVLLIEDIDRASEADLDAARAQMG